MLSAAADVSLIPLVLAVIQIFLVLVVMRRLALPRGWRIFAFVPLLPVLIDASMWLFGGWDALSTAVPGATGVAFAAYGLVMGVLYILPLFVLAFARSAAPQ